MIATIILFPTAIERDDIEFRRTGSTTYTRALDTSASLYAQAREGRHANAEFYQRLDALRLVVARLSDSRPEVLDDLIFLSDGAMFPLREMTTIIRTFASRAKDGVTSALVTCPK